MSDSISQAFAVYGIESLRPLVMGARHMAVAGHYGAAHAAFAILESWSRPSSASSASAGSSARADVRARARRAP